MLVVFFTANAESLSYDPGTPLRSARAKSESSFCAASSAGVSAATVGAEVSGLHPVRHGVALGFFALRFCREDCANASAAPPNDKLATMTNAINARNIEVQNNTELSGEPEKRAVRVQLVMACGRCVRIVAEGMRIAISKEFHHPAIKIVHRMIHDGFETAVVFSMSFFNVVFQSDAKILLFAAEPHLLRTEHFDVL